MKLTKTVFALTAVMLLTGCGGGKSGKKVEKDAFLEATANLPATHPFLGVTVKQHSEMPGEKATDKTTHFTWNGSDWEADDGYSYFEGLTFTEFLDQLAMMEQYGVTVNSLDYYIEPFAVKLDGTMYGYNIKSEAEWNEYGLMTYAYSSGAGAVERAEFTYETTPNN